jgi:hypothetical protein
MLIRFAPMLGLDHRGGIRNDLVKCFRNMFHVMLRHYGHMSFSTDELYKISILTACHGYSSRRQEIYMVHFSQYADLIRLQTGHREHTNLCSVSDAPTSASQSADNSHLSIYNPIGLGFDVFEVRLLAFVASSSCDHSSGVNRVATAPSGPYFQAPLPQFWNHL